MANTSTLQEPLIKSFDVESHSGGENGSENGARTGPTCTAQFSTLCGCDCHNVIQRWRAAKNHRFFQLASLLFTLFKIGWAIYLSTVVSGYYGKMNRMENRLTEMENAVNAATAHVLRAEQAADGAEAAANNATAHAAAVSSLLVGFQDTLRSISAEVADVSANFTSVSSDVSYLSAASAAVASNVSILRQQMSTTTSDLTMFQSTLGNLSGEMTALVSTSSAVAANVSDLQQEIDHAQYAIQPLANVNREDTIMVFGDDPRFTGPDGLQKAYDFVASHVLFRDVTIVVADGDHYLNDTIILYSTPYSSFITIRGASNDVTTCTLHFPPDTHGLDFKTDSVITVEGLTLVGSYISNNYSACIFSAQISNDLGPYLQYGGNLRSHSLRCISFFSGVLLSGGPQFYVADFTVRNISRLYLETGSKFIVRNLHLENTKPCTALVAWGSMVWIWDGTTVGGIKCAVTCTGIPLVILHPGAPLRLLSSTSCPGH